MEHDGRADLTWTSRLVTMTGHSSWRSLRSVMLVTLHVAVVAFVIRTVVAPATLASSLVWVPATISVAVFLSWPIGRAIARAFDPGELPLDRTCPKCGRGDIRPLLRASEGLFEPVSAFRCALCWTTMRVVEGSWVVEPGQPEAGLADPSGISFLSDPLSEDELRFLDEPSESPGGS
jgi:hypothetical protein